MPKPRLVCIVDKLDSEYVSRALAGMLEVLAPAGWDLETREGGSLIWDDRMSLLHEEAHSGLNTAAAFVHFHLTDDQASFFKSVKMPVGYMGGSLEGVDSVSDDGNEGCFLGALHLAELGHRHIALMIGDREIMESRMREAGFLRALRSKGIAPKHQFIMEIKPALAEGGFKAGMKLLQAEERPSAIFCAAGDLVAAGVYAAAAKLKLKIPRDLSVIGYDDLPQAAGMAPPLTTLRQPLGDMGRQLAAQLIQAAKEGASHKSSETLVKPSLEQRQSCAPPL